MFRKILNKLKKSNKTAITDTVCQEEPAEHKLEDLKEEANTIAATYHSHATNPYITLKEKKLINETDGTNPLHGCKTSEEISVLLEKHGRESVLLMARTPDLSNQIPFDCVDEALAQNVILPLMLSDQPLIPLSSTLDPQYFIAKFCSSSDIELRENMAIACQIINTARKAIQYSSSHPDFNQYPETLKIETINKIHRRWQVSDTKNVIDMVLKEKTADCGEFCTLCADLLIQSGYQSQIETFGIINGSHNFIVIGRDPRSDASDPSAWGPSAVVCDAWCGSVFPASCFAREALTLTQTVDLRNKLTPNINVVTAFVPELHTLEVRCNHTPDKPARGLSRF